jgi:hypothetical protein
MCGRSSDRQHDLTSEGSCHAGRVRRSPVPQQHTLLPDFKAARPAAVPLAFERDARLVMLDPGELKVPNVLEPELQDQLRGRSGRSPVQGVAPAA